MSQPPPPLDPSVAPPAFLEGSAGTADSPRSEIGQAPTTPAVIPPLDALEKRALALGFTSLADVLDALEEVDPGGDTDPKEKPMTTPAAPGTPTTPPGAAPSPSGAAPAPGATPIAPPAPAPAPIAPPTFTPPAPVPAPTPAPPAPAASVAELENDRKLSDAQRKKLRAAREDMTARTTAAEQARIAAEQQAATYQAQLEQFRAQQSMREDMIRDGVKELDFSWHLLQQHLAGLAADKTPEGEAKLKAFDLKAWCAELRKTRPYVFGEAVVPATTGATPPGGAPPAAPGPGAVAGAVGDASAVDARTLTPQQLEERYRSLGPAVRGAGPAMRS